MCEQHWMQVSMTIFGTLNYRRYICSFITGGFPITFLRLAIFYFFESEKLTL